MRVQHLVGGRREVRKALVAVVARWAARGGGSAVGRRRPVSGQHAVRGALVAVVRLTPRGNTAFSPLFFPDAPQGGEPRGATPLGSREKAPVTLGGIEPAGCATRPARLEPGLAREPARERCAQTCHPHFREKLSHSLPLYHTRAAWLTRNSPIVYRQHRRSPAAGPAAGGAKRDKPRSRAFALPSPPSAQRALQGASKSRNADEPQRSVGGERGRRRGGGCG